MTAPSVPIGAHPVGIANVHEVNRIEAETAFASVEPDVAAASADRVIQHGDAALRLAAVASETGALLVVGSRGRGPVRSAMVGSVVRAAHAPSAVPRSDRATDAQNARDTARRTEANHTRRGVVKRDAMLSQRLIQRCATP